MYQFVEIILSILVIFVIVLIIATPFGIGINYLKEVRCTEKYSEYNPQYTFLSGCRIIWEGKLTPVENIGYRDMQ